MKIFFTNSTEESFYIGKQLGKLSKPGDLFAITGPIGSGKTIMAKGLAKAIGVEEVLNSPTFSIVSEYLGTTRLYHIDAYRLNSEEDLIDLAYEDFFYNKKAICIVEWADIIFKFLPSHSAHINIGIVEESKRKIIINWDDREEGINDNLSY